MTWRKRPTPSRTRSSSDLVARIQAVELPPVLVAIEEMTDGVR